MADANANPAPGPAAPPRAPRGDNQNRGGRGGGAPRQRGPRREGGEGGAQNEGGRPPRNRNRGGANARARGDSAPGQALTPADLAAKFGSKPPAAAKDGEVPRPTSSKGKGPVEAQEEEEIGPLGQCDLCAGAITILSLSPCNHRMCHICALRMRALYKSRDCAHCRTESKYVLFTEDNDKAFDDYNDKDFAIVDHNIGIKYCTAQIAADSTYFLHYNCPEPTCDIAARGWPDLHRHVRSVHHKKMCDLCSRHKKIFTHEHKLFNDKELQKHMSKGDDNPGAVDQSGFRGHPLCGFCGERFYGDDELYVHCREKHERCFLCDRQDSRHPHYYVDYKALESHFRKDHFMCLDRQCQEKKFVVFQSELDLKAHQLSEHGDSLSKDVRRDARVVDISSFDYRTPYVAERRAGESQREARRGGGRGRDPNVDPIPASSAQPMRRDEIAYQRQLAIHSAQNVTSRTFGGQLTTPTPAQAAAQASTARGTARGAPRQVPGAQAAQEPVRDTTAAHATIADATPQELARRQQHAAVLEKATRMLGNDNLKVTQFRNALSSYRNNGVSASGLIDSFFALFTDTASSALGTLVRDVADLYDDKKKAEGIRTAWNDWRAINEDYPSLPGPSGMTGNASTGWAGITASMPPNVTIQPAKTSRVLRLKSSTAKSSKASPANSSSGKTWTGVSTPSLNNGRSKSDAFPDLPASGSSIEATPKIQLKPWVPPTSGASSSNSNTASPRPTPPPSRPMSRATGAGRGGATGGDFPSLPPKPKPTSTIFGYGNGRAVRRDHGNGNSSNMNAWAGSAAEAEEQAQLQEAIEASQGGKKKGNKGKKVLVQWG